MTITTEISFRFAIRGWGLGKTEEGALVEGEGNAWAVQLGRI